MITLKIDVTKIPKERIFIGKKGKYLDLKLVENRDGRDQYDNDGFVSISLSKEARDAGEKGEIIGNWKDSGQKKAPPPKPAARPATRPSDPDLDAPDESSDVPF